jgi:hypothetical protein
MNPLKISTGLELAGNQKEGKTEGHRFVGSRKCDKTWTEVRSLADNSQIRDVSQEPCVPD